MTRIPPGPHRSEQGATLVELLLVVVISGIIVSSLAAAFTVVARNTDSAQQRLTKSHDAQIAATYVISDAQSSSGAEVSLNDTVSCADPNPPVAGTATPVVRLLWSATPASGATTTRTANYVLVGTTLLRRYCAAGTLVSDVPVAHNVAAATATCSPASCGVTSTQVTLNVTETQAASETAAYRYSLAATFRKAPPKTPLIVLGANGLSVTGPGGLVVSNGAIVVNSNLSVSGSGGIVGVSTANVGGSASCSGPGPCPPVTPLPQALVDPYQGLSPPPATGLSTWTDGLYHGPGVYTTTLSFGDTPTILAPGTYILQNGLQLPGSGAVTSGVGGVLLDFQGGSLRSTGSAGLSLTAPTSGPYAGIAIFQPKTNTSDLSITGSGGLVSDGLIYAPGAKISLTGPGPLTGPALTAGSAEFTGSGRATLG